MEPESTTDSAARLGAALADRYVIERELGAGGMATVYLARDVKHDREVALKVLRPELAAVLGAERFLNEIRITARLDHPHILTLIDSGAVEGALYYVVPYVRGGSLRDRLTAQGQLRLDDALRLTTQIASALDYAHRQGVIHRDIKPENILFQEDMAMLADFGIALALRQAGGQRLTETGLSLGTPQYMSPEQATGDKILDARSDVYSLAAVLYEMLAGDPPITGSTVQAVIAKLLTERPTRLRVLRDTVPAGVEDAVAQALAKVPADRYDSAGAFASAIAAGAAGQRPAHTRSLALKVGLATAGLAALAGLGIAVARSSVALRRPAAISLRDRTQLTTSGRIRSPAISGDGKQLAYVTVTCDTVGCANTIEVQDVGLNTSRTILTGASELQSLSWSPDRRNLTVLGLVHGRFGWYLISTAGAEPRLLVTRGGVGFFAGGDTLLLWRGIRADSVQWIHVATIDGVPRDSIRFSGSGYGACDPMNVPGTSWILTCLAHREGMEWVVLDRNGQESDRRMFGTADLGHVSADALWIRETGSRPVLLRVPFDVRKGRFAANVDTLPLTPASDWDVTADGGIVMTDEGVDEWDVYVLDARDALRGKFDPERLLLRSSSPVDVQLAPDGRRVAITTNSSGAESRVAVRPLSGGAETLMPTRGAVETMWADSLTLALKERRSGRDYFTLLDVATGARRGELTPEDSTVGGAGWGWTCVPGGGWAWFSRSAIRVQRLGESVPRDFPRPAWFQGWFMLRASPDGRHLAYQGYKAPAADSSRWEVLSLVDGTSAAWATFLDRSGWYQWLENGSLLLFWDERGEEPTLYRVRGPGEIERLGSVPRQVSGIEVFATPELKRAVVTVYERRSDAWMTRVVRR